VADFQVRTQDKICKAPTCRELGERLPAYVEDKQRFACVYIHPNNGENVFYFDDDREVDARAKMLIHLVGVGLVKFKEANNDGISGGMPQVWE